MSTSGDHSIHTVSGSKLPKHTRILRYGEAGCISGLSVAGEVTAWMVQGPQGHEQVGGEHHLSLDSLTY